MSEVATWDVPARGIAASAFFHAHRDHTELTAYVLPEGDVFVPCPECRVYWIGAELSQGARGDIHRRVSP